MLLLTCLFHALFLHRQQELSNLIANKKYLEAIGLAITLEQPFRVLNIMKGTVNSLTQTTWEKLLYIAMKAFSKVDSPWNLHCSNVYNCNFSSVLSPIICSVVGTDCLFVRWSFVARSSSFVRLSFVRSLLVRSLIQFRFSFIQFFFSVRSVVYLSSFMI